MTARNIGVWATFFFLVQAGLAGAAPLQLQSAEFFGQTYAANQLEWTVLASANDPNGSNLGLTGNPNSQLACLLEVTAGTYYIANNSNGNNAANATKILSYTFGDSVFQEVAGGEVDGDSLGIDNNGNVYWGSSVGVRKYETFNNGALSTYIPGEGAALQGNPIAFDNNGNMIVGQGTNPAPTPNSLHVYQESLGVPNQIANLSTTDNTESMVFGYNAGAAINNFSSNDALLYADHVELDLITASELWAVDMAESMLNLFGASSGAAVETHVATLAAKVDQGMYWDGNETLWYGGAGGLNDGQLYSYNLNALSNPNSTHVNFANFQGESVLGVFIDSFSANYMVLTGLNLYQLEVKSGGAVPEPGLLGLLVLGLGALGGRRILLKQAKSEPGVRSQGDQCSPNIRS